MCDFILEFGDPREVGLALVLSERRFSIFGHLDVVRDVDRTVELLIRGPSCGKTRNGKGL